MINILYELAKHYFNKQFKTSFIYVMIRLKLTGNRSFAIAYMCDIVERCDSNISYELAKRYFISFYNDQTKIDS